MSEQAMSEQDPAGQQSSPGYAAATTSVAAIAGSRSVVEASGEEATTFLQGQLSQDVAALREGESAWSLLLAPQGKIDAWLRVTRLGENRFVLDVDAGWADAVVTRLSRFKLRTKCDLVPLDWTSVSLRGPQAGSVEIANAAVAASVEWGDHLGVDVMGPGVTVPDEVVTMSDDDFRALRIEGAIPAMGSELDETTIPAAAGIVDQSVSFTKGCYTGQELVARIDSRGGNVPQRLLQVVAAEGSTLAVGDEFVGEDKVVGRVTSAAWSPRLGRTIALAYIARAVASGDQVSSGGVLHQLVDELRQTTH